jgi:hypothetical protein
LKRERRMAEGIRRTGEHDNRQTRRIIVYIGKFELNTQKMKETRVA